VAVFTSAAEEAGISQRRFVLDTFALVWYPLAHARTLPSALGMRSRGPAFLEEQKRHLTSLLLPPTRRGDPKE
jgi:hypothetical protein